MQTFCISTLGCKVNQYESEQVAALLRSKGLRQVDHPEGADLRIVNTCSVTVQAASKSRQTVRQSVRLPILDPNRNPGCTSGASSTNSSRTIVTGCWATSDAQAASKLPGVSAVITHHDNVAERLEELLELWLSENLHPPDTNTRLTASSNTRLTSHESLPEPVGDEGWIIQAGTPAAEFTVSNKPHASILVNGKVAKKQSNLIGTSTLPLLGEHQTMHQRGFLKIQDGCDAHCTYCIIPNLRPKLWSKPIQDVISETRALVDAGHREIVLTGIFLSAYGQATALRRRQTEQRNPLGALIERLCEEVAGLLRVRLSSLEPGDLDDELVDILKDHQQVVPHFHLPLQSGSDAILRRMNRQYGRDDYIRMVDRLHSAFDRPALTTDIIVGFPGETDGEFERTLEVVDYAKFIHIHAFPFSPRPGTAAARWKDDFVHGPVVNERIDLLAELASGHSLAFRQSFVGDEVNLLVERRGEDEPMQHGRCERYFSVYFESDADLTGQSVAVRIDRVNQKRTFGMLVHP